MRWGIGFVLVSAALAMTSSGAAGAAEGPVYEEAPVYAPTTGPGRIRFSGLTLDRRSGRAIVFVRTPGAGRLILHGRGVRRLVRGARAAGIVRLPVKPKVRLMHFLRRHGKGRIRVQVGYQPDAGEPEAIERVVVLRRKRR
ncbi:MAG TPA: hypothetical protein VFN89_12905 [Solirubrobacterales bacterium]|nr:hypothetical protein [Solirubrobacterales bacterium]